MKTRILVVDDSPFIRRLITDWVKAEDDMDVVGAAKDGQEAVELARQLRPDIITMDVEMPNRDGLSALEEIMAKMPTPVLMVSSVTTQGAAATIRALDLGAVDFVTKPQSSTSIKFLGTRDELIAKIRACRSAKLGVARKRVVTASRISGGNDRVVVIASSTGGPRALATLWESLPKGFPSAILLVQHMPSGFTESLARRLDGLGTVPIREAKDGDSVEPGQALICPGGKHMVVKKGGIIELNEEPSIHGVRPAADYLFLSAAGVYGSKVLGVVLTGMGRDGADGAATLRRSGAVVYGESEETCTIYGMPKAALTAGGINAEFPIHEMGAAICAGLKDQMKHAS